jgi:hypothetical protein
MERGRGGGDHQRPELAAVSGSMPRKPSRHAGFGGPRFRACLSVGLSLPVVAVVDSRSRAGVEWRRAFGRSKRHATLRQPMERRQGGGNDRRPDLAAVSGAMPRNPEVSGRRSLGWVRSRAGAGACACARLPIRLSLPMGAAVGPRFRSGGGDAGGRIHDRASGARPLPIGHCRVGQHVDARLPLRGYPLLRAHPQGGLHVRSRRTRRRKSRGARSRRTRGPGPVAVEARRRPARRLAGLPRAVATPDWIAGFRPPWGVSHGRMKRRVTRLAHRHFQFMSSSSWLR